LTILEEANGSARNLTTIFRQEMEMVKEDAAKMKKFQSNIENIQGLS